MLQILPRVLSSQARPAKHISSLYSNQLPIVVDAPVHLFGNPIDGGVDLHGAWQQGQADPPHGRSLLASQSSVIDCQGSNTAMTIR